MRAKSLGGGLATWSIRHPIGVVMITLAFVVLGLFALGRLGIDLLPHIIYPDIRVRVLDPGVPAGIMEDQVTRQLEEQLAITEDAIDVQSRTSEGRSSVDLSFPYGKDIDIALRDASTRLDRAKRFLPDTIDPPVIYKRDPSQLPVAEFAISSPLRDPVALRTWVDYTLSTWLLNLPGVAAAEVGGGLAREIQVVADQERLAGLGLDALDLAEVLEQGNVETPGGRLLMRRGEISGRTSGRFQSLDELIDLPLVTNEGDEDNQLRLGEVAQVIDGAEQERLRIRLNGLPGIKLSIQKQPQANTVAVVDAVLTEIDRLERENLIPEDIRIHPVNDEARYVRNALRNALTAALSGALLAMLVVYLFLGSLRRTLIIGSAIPIAILVTFILMATGGLTFNIMTLGGLALGIGMLVDSTIVMLENIYRHQRDQIHRSPGRSVDEPKAEQTSALAATEVNSAIVASTSTNLAAVLPFLFIGGLVGLLFRELIFTISAAILAAMIVALTLVPALAGRLSAKHEGRLRRGVNRLVGKLQNGYGASIDQLLKAPWITVLVFIAGLAMSVPVFTHSKQIFLPQMDEGRVYLSITADRGTNLEQTDRIVQRLEELFYAQPEVDRIFSQIGGFVFGRGQYQASNRASIDVRLKPFDERNISSRDWIERAQKLVDAQRLAGIKIRMYPRGLRGIRFNRGDDDISLRVQGPEIRVLETLADEVTEKLRGIDGLRNVQHSAEEQNLEISVVIDRQRAADAGLSVSNVGKAVQVALEGIEVTDFVDDDRSLDVRLRLDRRDFASPADIENIILFRNIEPRTPLRLVDIAEVRLIPAPASIHRDHQQRVINIDASLSETLPMSSALAKIDGILQNLELPRGYRIYDAGSSQTLQEGRDLSRILLALALFLVFVVMAVQYESWRNPLIIILSVPFAIIGVAIGLQVTDLPLSMPIWLGLIMLAGIVVNNTIVLVEYIEIERRKGLAFNAAIIEAARLRLRPILMTTLTTVVGMAPLAMALGEGAEMLQPLAVTIVSGLLFSALVSLLLVPSVYRLLASRDQPGIRDSRISVG